MIECNVCKKSVLQDNGYMSYGVMLTRDHTDTQIVCGLCWIREYGIVARVDVYGRFLGDKKDE